MKAKKALVVSDTHRNKSSLKKIVETYGDMDYLFHLGDNVRDASYLANHMPDTQVIYVRGNCDGSADAPEFEEVAIKGNKIILTHGHRLNVKYSYGRALYYAQEHGAKGILFGHTHMAYTEYVDGVWLINPGSAGEDTRGDMSVAVLIITEAGIVPKIIKL